MKTMQLRASCLVAGSALILMLAPACDRRPLTPEPAGVGASSAVHAGGTTIAKVVFLDQEKACDCTRRRIEQTWAALRAALGERSPVPIERIHVDTQPDRARVYTLFEPLMVAPGVYFVDAHDAVVEMLQGEVAAEAIAAVLQRNASGGRF